MADEPFTVEVVGKTTRGLAGRDIVFADGPREVEMHVVEVAPGQAVGRHHHPGPSWGYVLEGTIVTAQTDTGEEHTYDAGETFVEDAGVWFDNRNPGTSPARFLGTVVGHADEPKVLFED